MRRGGPTLGSTSGDAGHTTRPRPAPATRATSAAATAAHPSPPARQRRDPGAAAGPDSDDSASRANDKSRADWNRSLGCFSRQRRTMRSSAGGVGWPATSVSSGGSLDSTAVIVSAGVAPLKARCPVHIS